jgi:hypothetical protein
VCEGDKIMDFSFSVKEIGLLLGLNEKKEER